MKEHIQNKIQLMLARYEKLGLQDSPLYMQLKHWVSDEVWLEGVVKTLGEVRNGEKIFDIVGQISRDDADLRITTMFAEYDTARRLTSWAKNFFGNFTEAEYMPRKNKRQPDFKVWNNNQVMPVETKTINGLTDIEAEKFYMKVVKKVRDDALPQLSSFYEETPFSKGIIFIWTQQHVKADEVRHNSYNEQGDAIRKAISAEGLVFDIQIIIMFSNPLDLWDYDIIARG